MQHPKLTSGETFFAVELPAPTEEQVRAYQKLTRNGELTWAEALAQLPPEEATALAQPPEAVPPAAETGSAAEPAQAAAVEEPAPIPEPEPRARRLFGRTFTVTRAVTRVGFPRLDGSLFIAPLVEFTKVVDATSTRWDVIWGSRNIQTQPRERPLATPRVDDATPEMDTIVAAAAGKPDAAGGAGMGAEPGFKAIGKFFYRTLMFRRAPKGQRPGSAIEGGAALHYFEIARLFHVDLPPSYGVLGWRVILGRFTFLLT